MRLSDIQNPVAPLFKLQGAERQAAVLLAVYFFLALTAVLMVKSLQNAIYLASQGFDWRLPALYIALALLSGPVVFLYRYLAGKYSQVVITTSTILSMALCLTAFWILRERVGDWIYSAFYIWAAIFSVLIPTQGWISSYQLFTPRIAKRVFVVLGTGGILGGVFGGYYTALMAPRLGTPGLFIHVLLLLALLQIVLCAVCWLSRSVTRERHPKPAAVETSGERSQTVRAVFQSRHLQYLTGLIILTGLVSTTIDLQFKWSLNARYLSSEAEIAQFMGAFLGTTYVISAIVQLLATSHILRRFGLGVGLMILPAGLMAGSLGILAFANFWSVVVAKAIDGSLRSSVEQTSVELLYVPLSEHQSIPLKSFLELVALRFGDGLGAAIYLFISFFILTPIQLIGLFVLLAAAAWLFVARQISEEYAQMLRRSLEFEGSHVVQRALDFDEAVAENTLFRALKSANPDKIHFALQQLRMQENDREETQLSTSELSGEWISVDVSGIYEASSTPPRWLAFLEPFLDHDDPRVASVALHLMIHHDVKGYRERLARELRSERIPDPRLLTFLKDYAEDPAALVEQRFAMVWSKQATPEQAVALAPVLAAMRDPSYLPVLRGWVTSASRPLRRAALRALGAFTEPEDVDLILGHLSENWSRRAARKALSYYGEPLVTRLLTLLRDPKADIVVKREIPNLLAQVNSSSARGLLVASLYTHDAVVAYRAVLGLNRIRDRHDLSYTQESFVPLLQIWAKEYYGLLNIDTLLHTKQTPASRLLQKAIKERLNWSIEKIFRGLDLFLPHGDAYFSYLGFTSTQQELRENAIELIDSRIKGELRHTLLPIFAELHPFDVVKKGREIFKLPSDPQKALSEAFFHGDPWLKCCTIAVVLEDKMEDLKGLVTQACDDINPTVNETAKWAIAQWGQDQFPS
jgi:AAA family ATP:ADP antiporter